MTAIIGELTWGKNKSGCICRTICVMGYKGATTSFLIPNGSCYTKPVVEWTLAVGSVQSRLADPQERQEREIWR